MTSHKEIPSSKEAPKTAEKTKNEEIFGLIDELSVLDLRFNKRTEEATKELGEVFKKYDEIAASLSPEEEKELSNSMYLLAKALMELNTFGFLTNKEQKEVERAYEGLPYEVNIDFRALQTLANSGISIERRGEQLVFTGVTFNGQPNHIDIDSATIRLEVRQTDHIHPTVEVIASNNDGTSDTVTLEYGEITKVEKNQRQK